MDESQDQKSPSKKNLLDLRHEITSYVANCREQLAGQYRDEVYDAIKKLFDEFQSKPLSYYIDNDKHYMVAEYKGFRTERLNRWIDIIDKEFNKGAPYISTSTSQSSAGYTLTIYFNINKI